MYFSLIIFIAVTITEISSQDIKTKIQNYFDSDTVKSFENEWNKYKKPFENSINMALQQAYGYQSMNVYINRQLNPLRISKAYYHTDNEVHIVFTDMELEELPHLYVLESSFALASNILSLKATVSKMIIRTEYVLFRNKSDIIYDVKKQEPYKSSPFRFQQVNKEGELAISVEGCQLTGKVMTKLSGHSVNLDHSIFNLQNCQYNLEICSSVTGSPPVIAQYMPKGKGVDIDSLLMRPLLEELMPKLQATVFSYVNTTAIFGDLLPNIIKNQKAIIDDTDEYINNYVKNMNKATIQQNLGTKNINDFTIAWDDTFEEMPMAKTIEMRNMVLVGLDTLFSSHIGGAYKFGDIEMAERLKFNTLQVIGNISVLGSSDYNEFAVEISDLHIDATAPNVMEVNYDVLGWRNLDFSCSKTLFLPIESIVTGILLEELPKYIISHLKTVNKGQGQNTGDITNLNMDDSSGNSEVIQDDASDRDIADFKNRSLANSSVEFIKNYNKNLSETPMLQIAINYMDLSTTNEDETSLNMNNADSRSKNRRKHFKSHKKMIKRHRSKKHRSKYYPTQRLLKYRRYGQLYEVPSRTPIINNMLDIEITPKN